MGLCVFPQSASQKDSLSPLPSRERVGVRGRFPYRSKFDCWIRRRGDWRLRRARSMAARGQSLLAIAQKVTKNACPCTTLFPAVLATGGRHWTSHGRDADASPIVRCSAATTARCSAPRRGLKGRSSQCDRFAMRNTRARMQASGLCRLPASYTRRYSSPTAAWIIAGIKARHFWLVKSFHVDKCGRYRRRSV